MTLLAGAAARAAGLAVEKWVSTPWRFFEKPGSIPAPPSPELLAAAKVAADRAVVLMFGLMLQLLVAIGAIASFFYLTWRDKKKPPVVHEPFDWTGSLARLAFAFALSEGIMLALWCAMCERLPTLPGGVAAWSLSAVTGAVGFIMLRYRALSFYSVFGPLLLLFGMGGAFALVDGSLALRPTPWLAFAAAVYLLWRPPAASRESEPSAAGT